MSPLKDIFRVARSLFQKEKLLFFLFRTITDTHEMSQSSFIGRIHTFYYTSWYISEKQREKPWHHWNFIWEKQRFKHKESSLLLLSFPRYISWPIEFLLFCKYCIYPYIMKARITLQKYVALIYILPYFSTTVYSWIQLGDDLNTPLLPSFPRQWFPELPFGIQCSWYCSI